MISKPKDSFCITTGSPYPAHAIPTLSLSIHDIISLPHALPLLLHCGKLKWLVLQRNALASDEVDANRAAKS